MTLYARAMYDFQGDESQGEISLAAGDDVVIYRQDIGEGWWEGEVDGKKGLFPETYVEILEGTEVDGDYATSGSDEWPSGDEEEPWNEEEYEPTAAAATASAAAASSSSTARRGGGGGGVSRAPGRASSQTSGSYPGHGVGVGRADTLRKSMNRMTAFVRTGAEGFIIDGGGDKTINPANVIHMVDGPMWATDDNPMPLIKVDHRGTQSKFKGMKKYEAYNLSGVGNVERRHKHFVWLHERLKTKYSLLCVPPLPDKSHSSKFGETFVAKRQAKLEAWINRVARHPVLSRDKLALHHFLTCGTMDKEWKNGKRKAEADPFTGATFFKLISQDVPCPRDSEKDIEEFGTFVRDFQKVVRKNIDTVVTHCDRLDSVFNKEYKGIGAAFDKLSHVFSERGGQSSGDYVKLSMAISEGARCMEEIGNAYAQQPANTHIPLIDGLKEYQGMLSTFHDSVSSSRSAAHRLVEIQDNEGAKPQEKENVRARCEVIHAMTLCEMHHFHESRRGDFRDMMSKYFEAQMQFHLDLAEKYKKAKADFDKLQF